MPVNVVLKEARNQKGYSLEDMAHMLGYKSKVTYYYIENGKSKVTLEVASKIAKILDKPLEELFSNFFRHGVQETQTLNCPLSVINQEKPLPISYSGLSKS